MRLIFFAVMNLVLLVGAAVAAPTDGVVPPSQVTIEARQEELKSRVSAYVADVMSQDAGSLGEPIAVWNWPLCFSVSGLPKEEAVYVLNRISKDAETVGAPLAKDEKGCHPNFVVIVTPEPEKVLRAWYHHDQLIYNCAFPMPVNEFVGTPLAGARLVQPGPELRASRVPSYRSRARGPLALQEVWTHSGRIRPGPFPSHLRAGSRLPVGCVGRGPQAGEGLPMGAGGGLHGAGGAGENQQSQAQRRCSDHIESLQLCRTGGAPGVDRLGSCVSEGAL